MLTIEVKYNKVIEYPESHYPVIDFREEFGKEASLEGIILLSKHKIQFYSPLQADKDDESKYLINLDRDDAIKGYTNDREEGPLWKVDKQSDGTVTLWPSIIWFGSDPEQRQHFWFRDNKAIVLQDSWIFKYLKVKKG